MKFLNFIFALFLLSNISYALERINGTKVSLDIPKGFTKASQFPGYMKQDQSASIMVTELPAPYTQLIQGFTKQNLASRGMVLLKKEKLDLVVEGALLIHIKQKAQGIDFLKWMFVFGKDKQSVMIVATFPEKFKGLLSEPLKKSVLSAQWDINAKVDFFEGLTFRVKEQPNLLIAKKIGNNILLTKDGVFPQASKLDPFMVVGSSISESWTIPKNIQDFSKKRLAQTDILKGIKIVSEKEIQINSSKSYFIEAHAQDKESNESLYVFQCIVISTHGYYIIQGVATSRDEAKYKSIFQSVLDSFKTI